MPKLPAPLSVALIDDCPILRYLCRRSFERQGIAVRYEAANGSDFLIQLEGQGALPDACLLDIDMPVLDGYETARRLSLLFPAITILAYSSNTEPGVAGRAVESGAHGFIAKGCRPAAYGEALIRLHMHTQIRLRSPPVVTDAIPLHFRRERETYASKVPSTLFMRP